jgi:hypothetical protein
MRAKEETMTTKKAKKVKKTKRTKKRSSAQNEGISQVNRFFRYYGANASGNLTAHPPHGHAL